MKKQPLKKPPLNKVRGEILNILLDESDKIPPQKVLKIEKLINLKTIIRMKYYKLRYYCWYKPQRLECWIEKKKKSLFRKP